jgi:hypothetical protein
LSLRAEIERLGRLARSLPADGVTDPERWRWYDDTCPCGLPAGECTEHPRARTSQRPPEGDWRTWAVQAGRGFGKSRCGAEWVRSLVESGKARRVALVAPTAADARDVMIEGESGLLAVCPPWHRPRYEPSKRRLTWPNGAMATAYSADEPERLRGPQHSHAWIDEVGSWRRPAAWDNLALGLRLGTDPRVCATFTPRGTSLVKAILASPTTRKTGGTTYENARHLAPEFIESTRARYEGTRLGRQEVYAELLEQLEGCWFHDFDPARNVTTEAEWDPALAARLAVDCGVSRYTGAVFYQVRELGPYRHRVTVFGDYLAADRMSADNAGALRELSMSLCNGRLERVRLDPASSAHTGVGPAALAEYQQAFGTRILAFWLMHGVTDGLDTLELLVGSATREPDLLIHPRCVHLIQAFNGYTRELWGGEWMPWPDPLQHPAEDLMDALRGGVRDALPEGRKPQPAFRRVPAWGVF